MRVSGLWRKILSVLSILEPADHMPRKTPLRKQPHKMRPVAQAAALRIIGGRFRGRKLAYHGDPQTRPMKDRVREALFNLLGPAVAGQHAVDPFAGTGALGLEALSRGAARATFIERHFPTADVIRHNIKTLGVDDLCDVQTANTLLWYRTAQLAHDRSWLVLCSPPYDLYVERLDELLAMIDHLNRNAPVGSQLAVEADARFDFGRLPDASDWDVRNYPPAFIGLRRVPPR